MTRPILTLRISRRAIGAAVLDADTLRLADGRHLTSRRERATASAVRYLVRLLDTAKPAQVVLDVPHAPGDRADRVVEAMTTVLRERQLATIVIHRSDVLSAYGVRPLESRSQLRRLAQELWPELERINGRVQPYVADAAVAALYAESRLALQPQPL